MLTTLPCSLWGHGGMNILHIGVTFISILISAFGGTTAAFFLEQWRRRRQERRRDQASGQRALFALVSQYTALRNLADQHLDPNRHKAERWALSAARSAPQAMTIYMPSLMFLLDGQTADLLNHLMVGEAKFLGVIELLRARAE